MTGGNFMIYAVCVIKRGDKEVGVRLLNMDTGMVTNVANQQLLTVLSQGRSIRNLGIKDNKIDWVQGAIDRYPVIDADTLNVTKNKDSLTVLGYKDDDELGKELQHYTVANYLGQTVILDEHKLIGYARQYPLTNCKLVEKNGMMPFISSLSGDLNYVDSRIELAYDIENNEIIFKMPQAPVNKIEIPNRIKGVRVVHPIFSYVVPQVKAKDIQHIKVANGIELVGGGVFSPFTRLRTIDINSRIKRLLGGLRENFALEGFRLNYLEDGIITSDYFKGLENLKVVDIKNIKSIHSRAFKDCKSLLAQSVLTEGVIEIEAEAFSGCRDTEIILPKTVKAMSRHAFNGCKNLKKIIVQSSNFEISTGYGEDKTELGLQDCGNIELYVPYGVKIKYYFGDNVTVIEADPTDADIKAERIEQKAALLGIDIEAHKAAENPQEMIGIMKSLSEEQWNNIVKEILIDVRNNERNRVIYGVDGFKFRAIIEYRRDIVNKVDVGEKFALIWGKNWMRVVLIDKHLSIKRLENGQDSGWLYRNYCYVFPTKHVSNSSTNPIAKVSINENGYVQITRKYGNKVEIIDSF